MDQHKKIRDTINQLNKFIDKDAEVIASNQVGENMFEIISLLQGQLTDGEIGPSGVSAPTYASYTRLIAYNELEASGGRSPRNPRKSGKWNFEWSGTFYDSMGIQPTDEGFEIKADPRSIADLQSKVAPGLMQLSKKNMKFVFKTYIEPEIGAKVLDIINKAR